MYLLRYSRAVPQVVLTEIFAAWLASLRDARGRVKILARLERLSRGNSGDVAPIGQGLSEMKIDFGPGYRVYYGVRDAEFVLVLGGGDKSTQVRDIKAARELWREWKEDNDV